MAFSLLGSTGSMGPCRRSGRVMQLSHKALRGEGSKASMTNREPKISRGCGKMQVWPSGKEETLSSSLPFLNSLLLPLHNSALPFPALLPRFPPTLPSSLQITFLLLSFPFPTSLFSSLLFLCSILHLSPPLPSPPILLPSSFHLSIPSPFPSLFNPPFPWQQVGWVVVVVVLDGWWMGGGWAVVGGGLDRKCPPWLRCLGSHSSRWHCLGRL